MNKALSISTANLSLLSIDSLAAYQQTIAGIAVLTAEEELVLAREYSATRSLEAARQLTVANLKFVAHIARSYSGYGLNQMDLIQEGNIGLMKAIKKFDPEKNVRLISFAVHWIKSEIHEFIVRNWRIVKIATTKEQRKLFFNLRKKAKRLGWLNNEEVEDIARDLNVKPATVCEMEKRINMPEMGFDLPDSAHDDKFTPSQYLADHDSNPSQIVEYQDSEQQQHLLMQQALATLDGRSAEIIRQRWLQEPKATLTDLATKYEVSAERIRQIEQVAFKKIRQVLPEKF